MAVYVNLDTIQRASAGANILATWGTQVNDNFAYLVGFVQETGNPAGRLFQGAAQSLTASGFTKLNLGSQSFVTGGMTAVLSASALQVPIAGYYQICGAIQFSTPSAAANLGVGIFKNGVEISFGVQQNSVAGAGAGVTVSDIIQCAANDQLTLQGFQGSTVTTAINNTGSAVSNYLAVALVGQ